MGQQLASPSSPADLFSSSSESVPVSVNEFFSSGSKAFASEAYESLFEVQTGGSDDEKGATTPKKPKPTLEEKSSDAENNEAELGGPIQDLGDTSLDAFLEETDEPEPVESRAMPNDFEREVFTRTLQCLMLPAASTIRFDENDTVDLRQMQNVLTVLRKTFPWVEIVDNYRSILDRAISEQVKVMGKRDSTADIIKNRITKVESDKCKGYTKDDFHSEEEYENWKQEELDKLSNLMNQINESREVPFQCVMQIKLTSVTIEEQYISYPNVENAIHIKIGQDPYERSEERWNSEKETIMLDMQGYCKIKDVEEKISITIGCSTAHISNTETGTVELDMRDIIKRAKLRTSNFPWGACKLEDEEFEIFAFDKKKYGEKQIGTLKGEILLKYHEFPDVIFHEADQRDYKKMFELLCTLLAASRKVVDTSNSENQDALLRTKLFTPTQLFVIDSFTQIYGLSEATKQLSILKCFCQRADLLLTYSQNFAERLHILSKAKQDHKLTRTEQKELQDTVTELLEFIENTYVRHFRKFITVAEPKHSSVLVFKTLLQLHSYLYKEVHGSESNYVTYLQDLVREGLEAEYKEIEDGFEKIDVSAVIVLAKFFKKELDVLWRMTIFTKGVREHVIALEVYYENLARDYEQLSEFEKKSNPEPMLVLYKLLDDLHEEIEDYEEEDQEKIANIKIDTQKRRKELITLAVEQCKQRIDSRFKASTAIDNFEPVAGEKYSSSIIDAFFFLNNEVVMFKEIPFISQDILESKLVPAIIEITQNYQNQLYEECISQIPKRSVSSILDFPMMNPDIITTWNKMERANMTVLPTSLFVKMNNIFATEMQLRDLLKRTFETFEEESLTRVHEKTEEMLDTLIDDISEMFRYPIEASFWASLKMMDNVPLLMDSTEESFRMIDQIRSATVKLFIDFIDPTAKTLSESLYQQIFKRVLLSLLRHFCNCFEQIYLPIRPLETSSSPSPSRVNFIFTNIDPIKEYIGAEGSNIDEDEIAEETSTIFTLNQYDRKTGDEIAKEYKKNGKLEIRDNYTVELLRQKKVSQSVIVQVLDKRIKNFYKIETKEKDLIVDTTICWDQYNHIGYAFLTKTNHLLFESNMANVQLGEQVNKLTSFIHLSKYVYKIKLEEIIDIKANNSENYKTLFITFNTKVSGASKTYCLELHFKRKDKFKRKLLERLSKCNSVKKWTQNKLVLHTPIILQEKKTNQEALIEAQTNMVERFNLNKKDTKFISQMNVKLENNQGLLFLFNTCIVFTRPVAKPLIIHWYDVSSVSITDNKLNVVTANTTYVFESKGEFASVKLQYDRYTSKRADDLVLVKNTKEKQSWEEYFFTVFKQKCIAHKDCKMKRGFKKKRGRMFIGEDKIVYFMTEDDINGTNVEATKSISIVGAKIKIEKVLLKQKWNLTIKKDDKTFLLMGKVKEIGEHVEKISKSK